MTGAMTGAGSRVVMYSLQVECRLTPDEDPEAYGMDLTDELMLDAAVDRVVMNWREVEEGEVT